MSFNGNGSNRFLALPPVLFRFLPRVCSQLEHVSLTLRPVFSPWRAAPQTTETNTFLSLPSIIPNSNLFFSRNVFVFFQIRMSFSRPLYGKKGDWSSFFSEAPSRCTVSDSVVFSQQFSPAHPDLCVFFFPPSSLPGQELNQNAPRIIPLLVVPPVPAILFAYFPLNEPFPLCSKDVNIPEIYTLIVDRSIISTQHPTPCTAREFVSLYSLDSTASSIRSRRSGSSLGLQPSFPSPPSQCFFSILFFSLFNAGQVLCIKSLSPFWKVPVPDGASSPPSAVSPFPCTRARPSVGEFSLRIPV